MCSCQRGWRAAHACALPTTCIHAPPPPQDDAAAERQILEGGAHPNCTRLCQPFDHAKVGARSPQLKADGGGGGLPWPGMHSRTRTRLLTKSPTLPHKPCRRHLPWPSCRRHSPFWASICKARSSSAGGAASRARACPLTCQRLSPTTPLRTYSPRCIQVGCMSGVWEANPRREQGAPACPSRSVLRTPHATAQRCPHLPRTLGCTRCPARPARTQLMRRPAPPWPPLLQAAAARCCPR